MKKALLTILITAALPAAAQESQSRMEQLMAMDLQDLLQVEIATGSPIELRKAPAVATIITANDIKAMGARNLVEVLDTVPGMHVARNGQAMAPRFWFRGITSTYTPQTLLMINGVRTKSLVRGDNHVVWGEYPIHSIARIEIIRGPGSALYGSDAFSGVINIITKTAEDIKHAEVGGSIGSFDTYNVWANVAKNIDDWSLALNFEYTQSDGFDSVIETDAQTAIDASGDALFESGGLPFNPANASLAPGRVNTMFETVDLWLNAENSLFSINLGLQERSDVGTGQGITEALDDHGRFKGYKQLLKAALKPQQINDDLSIAAEFHYYRSAQEIATNLKLFPDGAFFGAFPNGFIGNPGWKEQTLTLETKSIYTGIEDHSLTLGVGYSFQDVYQVTESKNFNADFSPKPEGVVDVSDTSEVFMPEESRNNYFVYLQDIYNLADDWQITAGIRFDDYSDFGSTTNPRLALVWTAREDLTLKLLYGRAFRAPAFAETLTVNNPVSLGNPDIGPEVIDTTELAGSFQASDKLNINFNIFRYDIKDLISFVPDAGMPTQTAQNVGKRTGQGIELEGKYQYSKQWNLVANYAYVKAEDDLLDDDVGEYPNHQAYIRSNWTLQDNWNFHAQVSIIGERERIPGDYRESLSGYTTVDIGANYYIKSVGLDIELLARNVLDENIKEPSTGTTDGVTPPSIINDLPQAGHSFYLRASKVF